MAGFVGVVTHPIHLGGLESEPLGGVFEEEIHKVRKFGRILASECKAFGVKCPLKWAAFPCALFGHV